MEAIKQVALLFCAATIEELSALSPQYLKKEDFPNNIELFKAKKGPLTNNCLLSLTGVGPINAALTMGINLSKNLNIDCVINVGLAGAYDLERTPLNSLCYIYKEIWPEYGLHDGNKITARAFSHPLWAEKDIYDELNLDDFEMFAKKYRINDEVIPCKSVTVSGVSASFSRARYMWDTYHAELENMEGFSVAYSCLRKNIKFIEIRCVSNKVGPRTKDEKDFPGALKTMSNILPILGLA